MSITLLSGDCRDVLPTLAANSVHCVISADTSAILWYDAGMNDVASLTEAQVAYIAGLIDGEGSLECQMQMQKGAATPVFTLRLSFTFGTAEPITTVGAGVRALNTVPRTTKGGYGAHRRMPAHAVEQMTAMHTALRGMKSNKRAVGCR